MYLSNPIFNCLSFITYLCPSTSLHIMVSPPLLHFLLITLLASLSILTLFFTYHLRKCCSAMLIFVHITNLHVDLSSSLHALFLSACFSVSFLSLFRHQASYLVLYLLVFVPLCLISGVSIKILSVYYQS